MKMYEKACIHNDGFAFLARNTFRWALKNFGETMAYFGTSVKVKLTKSTI